MRCWRHAPIPADVVSARLDALILGDVQRTYLGGIDGYWADLVLEEFAFLEQGDGRLSAVAFHQKGDYVRYDGPWGAVVLELAPDNYPQGLWIWGEAKVRTDHASFQGDLDALVREQLRETPLPSAATLDRETIATYLSLWAAAVRAALDPR